MGNDNQKSTYTDDFIGPINYRNAKSYIISKENYEHFLDKNPNQQLQIKGKINVDGEYYVISETAYNEYVYLLQNDQESTSGDLQPIRRQVFGPINYHDDRKFYVISKENYEYVLRKIPNQQAIEEPAAGPISINEEYYVISKRAYNYEYILQNDQQNLRLQRFLQQLVQPTNYCGKECYIIDIDNYENFLGRKIPFLTRNEDYYLISEKDYFDFMSHNDHQQNLQILIQRLVRQIKHRNRICYAINIQNHGLFLGNIPFEVIKYKNYAISKKDYDEYIYFHLFIQQFMQRLIQPINYHNREYYVLDREYYLPNQQIIEQHVIGPINVNEEYYIINKEAYNEYFLQNDQRESLISEQQKNQLLIQQFMLRFVQSINYHNTEYCVIDKEYYLPNQQILEQHVIVGPINVNEEYYLINKEAYDHFSGNLHNVPKNKRNRNVKELEQNYQKLSNRHSDLLKAYSDLQSRNQSLETNCLNLRNDNNKLKEEVNKYQSALGNATTFHLGNQDSNSTGQLSEDIRNLHHNLETFCRVKKGVEIKPKAKELLEKYNCSITGKLNKNLISGALERKVIETIIEKTNEYLNREEDDKYNKIDDEQQQSLEVNKDKKSDEQDDEQSLETNKDKKSDEQDDEQSLETNKDKKSDEQDDEKRQQSLEANNDKKIDEQDDEKRQQSLEANKDKKGEQDDDKQQQSLEVNKDKESDEQGDEKQQQNLEANEDKKIGEQGDEKQQNLEAKIVKATEQLMKMTDLFSTIRTGTDEVSKAASTKLRQQIYGILGNRGFSNIVTDKENPEHPLIVKLREDILDLMNYYRKIKNHEKLEENEKMISEIIMQVINIFFFRLKVQEPIAEWKWLPNNTKINTLTMEASWDENEENLYFDLCAFPLIGCNLTSTDGDEKVIFPAQVIMNTS